jgi:hypothetical protein
VWARWFQQLAKRFNHPQGLQVTLLAQTHDDAFKEALKNEGRYEASRVVGESKEIEDAADYIMTVYCSPNEKKDGFAKVQLLKNRHGEDFHEPEQIAIDPSRFMVQDWERSEELDAYTIDIM